MSFPHNHGAPTSSAASSSSSMTPSSSSSMAISISGSASNRVSAGGPLPSAASLPQQTGLEQQFHYLRPRNPQQLAYSQSNTRSGLDSPRGEFDDGDDDESQQQTISAEPDFDSPGVHDTALELPSFHPVDRVEDDEDEEDDDAAGGADSDQSWSVSDSDSQESASASDGAWYGHGRMPASHNSSVASRLVNLDEEISIHEQSSENARHAAKLEASRKKRQEEQNASMACPPMCGVSWGIGGQLIYFSNLPLLTHYLVNNQRRRQKPSHTNGSLNINSDVTPSPSDAYRLMQSAPLNEPNTHIDHEEEENSAWAGSSAAHVSGSPTSISLSALNSSSQPASYSSMLDVDEVLPRTYQDLLQLPFVAAHLGYVVGEDMEERPEEIVEQEVSTPTEASVSTPATIAQWPANADGSTTNKGEQISLTTIQPAATPNLPADALPPSLPAATPLESVLDLGSIDLDSVSLPSSAAGVSRPLKVSLSSASLPQADSGTQLDQLTDTYDVLDEYDIDSIGMSGQQQQLGGGGGSNGGGSSAAAGSEDFFSSFYNSTLQLGVSAVGSAMKAAAGAGLGAGKKIGGEGNQRPSVVMVPPLPSAADEKGKSDTSALDATVLSSPNAASDPPASSSLASPPGAEPSAHSWSSLSSRTLPPTLHSVARRRIRINTSVLIMDCQDIMPCSKRLAKEYSLSGPDCVSVCLANQRVCERMGRMDLAQTWQLAAIISEPQLQRQAPSLTPWREHPMGGKLAEQLIQQHLRVGDIQTVAMLTSVFSFRASQSSPHSTSLLPSRPPACVIEVQETEGTMVPASSTTAVIVSPYGAASGGDSPSPSPQQAVMVPSHPMALLPSTAEGSSRTWGPGSKTALSNARVPSSSGSFKNSAYSSGTASPSDSIYNTNAMQRTKWRDEAAASGYGGGGGSGSASGGGSRMRSGSLTSRAENITRIEEGEQQYQGGVEYVKLIDGGSGITTRNNSGGGFSHSPSQPLLWSPTPLLHLRLDVFDLYLYLYAEYLYRIGEYSIRAKVLKFLIDEQPQAEHALTGFQAQELVCGVAAVCSHCGAEQKEGQRKQAQQQQQQQQALTPTKASPGSRSLSPTSHLSGSITPPLPSSAPLVSPRCSHCFRYPLSCSLCQVSVKGLTLLCALCGHGGHPHHVADWFRSGHAECPAACGCQCEAAGGLSTRGEASTAHRGKHARRKKKEAEMRAMEAQQRQQAAAEAQLADAEEEQAAADEREADHTEQLQHFYNPATSGPARS